MVEEGTRAYLEVTDSDLLAGPPPAHVVISTFANRYLYVVLANYGNRAVELATRDPYVPAESDGGTARTRWSLAPRCLLILRRADSSA